MKQDDDKSIRLGRLHIFGGVSARFGFSLTYDRYYPTVDVVFLAWWVAFKIWPRK